MVRLLLEDVTLVKGETLTLPVRFKGGLTQTVEAAIPPRAWEQRQTKPAVVALIDQLLQKHTEGQIAERLNELGMAPGMGGTWHGSLVGRVRRKYGLASRYERLRQTGLLTIEEMAEHLGVSCPTVKIWRSQGLLQGQLYNDRCQYLYEPLEGDGPKKSQGRKLSERRRFPEIPIDRTDEV